MPLFWLFLASLLGAFLRYYQLDPVAGVNFQYWVHGHSHTALLGWGFTAFFVLIIYQLFPHYRQSKPLNFWFWGTQISVAGMALTFPFQGYGLYSIIFSTIHLLLFYGWVFWLYKKENPRSAGDKSSYRYVLFTAFFFMLVSSLGPWSLGVLSTQDMQMSPLYDLSIQFYLHFLIEGWLVLAIVALFLGRLQLTEGILPQKSYYLWGYGLALFLLFGLYPANAYDNQLWSYVALLGGIIQVLIIGGLMKEEKPLLRQLWQITPLPFIAKIAFGAVLLKALFQLAVALPFTSADLIGLQPLKVGYLHLVLLGFFTLTTLLLYGIAGFLNLKYCKTARWSIKVFLSAAALHIVILLVQGLLIHYFGLQLPAYAAMLFISGVGMVMAIAGILVSAIKRGQAPD